MKKLEKMMQEGINENDLKKVAWALNLGLNINGVLNDGMPSLHWAVRWGHITMVKLLISAGADVNAENKSGDAPLFWAVCRDNVALAKLLISAGADVNVKWGHCTLLHWAVSYGHGHKEMQDLLKKHGAIV